MVAFGRPVAIRKSERGDEMEPITSSLPAALTTSQTPPTTKPQEQKNQFLQLLVAQIKGQNPLNPMEGSEFVSQLAQFSSLEELTKISGTLDTVQQLLSGQNLGTQDLGTPSAGTQNETSPTQEAF